MRRLTRRMKINKNKTFKVGGGDDDRKGIVDIITDKALDVGTTVGDSALKIVGLERINKENNANVPSNQPSSTDSNTFSAINNVNEVLDSDYVQSSVNQVAQDTLDIGTKLSQNINEVMDNPEAKEEIKHALDNVGELSSIAVDALKEPVSKGIDNIAETVNESAPKFGRAVGKGIWDFLTAIPPISIAADAINIANDVTKATSAAVEAGTEVVESTSDIIRETTDNFKQNLEELNKQKKISTQITNRTNKSIDEFANGNMSGGKKSKRRLLRRKYKTKRVRFNV